MLGIQIFDLVYMENLVYIWYIFDRGFTCNLKSMCLLSNKAEIVKTQCGKAISKSLVILCNMEISGLAENKTLRQCCHSVMKKNPRIYLEKTQKIIKALDIQNV